MCQCECLTFLKKVFDQKKEGEGSKKVQIDPKKNGAGVKQVLTTHTYFIRKYSNAILLHAKVQGVKTVSAAKKGGGVKKVLMLTHFPYPLPHHHHHSICERSLKGIL